MERRPTDSRIDPGVFYISPILLLVGGNNALQQTAIISAAPFLIVMFGICWSLLKELCAEALPAVAPEPERMAIRPTGAPAPRQTRGVDPEPRG